MRLHVGEQWGNHRPLRVPTLDSDYWPSSDTPAFNHFWIRRSIRGSATRCSTNFNAHSCDKLAKNPRMSASSTQFRFFWIPTVPEQPLPDATAFTGTNPSEPCMRVALRRSARCSSRRLDRKTLLAAAPQMP